MHEYTPPLKDMHFVLRELVDLEKLSQLPGYEDATQDLVDAILEEAGRFASGVLSPLNSVGDQIGAKWQEGNVITAPGWQDAYARFVDGGWNGISCSTEYEGQGLPRLVSTLVDEMWNGANLAFALCPMLNRGAVEALELRGSAELKETFLSKMVTGEWTGTMNLTESQAGSDLSTVRSRAVPQQDGSYKLFGQKIFITYGEHDLTENIIHLVLARTPDAPEGVKGISLFLVPKFLVGEDGSPGARNDVHCVSIEHKLGIHGSPTAILAFGDQGGEALEGAGAVGYLIGEENRGLEYMFIMMNASRFNVGVEGVGLSERAYQRALAYAKERTQGTQTGVKGGSKVPIINHPDVRRMLLILKSRAEAMRAVACVVAEAMDTAFAHPDPEIREQNQAFVDLMIPVVKGWSTESAVELTSLSIQIHGGMGYIEETGAAQDWRDARITPIYEGTTGIQANDLVGRKIFRDKGQAVAELIGRMQEVQVRLSEHDDPDLHATGEALAAGIKTIRGAVEYILANYENAPERVLVGAVPFLQLMGIVTGGWQMGRAAITSRQRLDEGNETDPAFYLTKIATTRFYADYMLPQASALAHVIIHGSEGVSSIDFQEL